MAETTAINGATPQYDLGKVVGFKYDDIPVSWNERDAILYALSIGAKNEELSLIYENDPDFAPFPTFATTLSVKGVATNVQKFPPPITRGPGTSEGLPPLKPATLIIGSQYLEMLKPLPRNADAKDGWMLKKWTAGVHENSLGVSLDNQMELHGPDGSVYAKLVSENRYNGATANGTPYDKTLPTLPNIVLDAEMRERLVKTTPTYSLQIETSKQNPQLFRLNGDYNPLHVDPNSPISKAFGGVILHGISYYARVARALLYKIGDNKPENLKRFYADFNPKGPVYPGDSIVINVWEVPIMMQDNSTCLLFEAVNATTGKVSLLGGVAHIIKGTVKETPPVTAVIGGGTAQAASAPAAAVAGAIGKAVSRPSAFLPADVPLKSYFGLVAFAPLAIAFSVVSVALGSLGQIFTSSE